MKLVPRDGIFIAGIIVVLGVILAGNLKAKPKAVPSDEKHRRFYDVMQQGGQRLEVEKGCTSCHGRTKMPLSTTHPPKEHCLLCHKLVQAAK